MLAVSPHDFHRRPVHHTIRAVAREEQARAGSGRSSRTPLGRGLAAVRAEHLSAQAVRFIFSGVVVSAVYIAITTFLAEGLHLQFQVALAIGWCTAISVHFTLQRTFVWTQQAAFALRFKHQMLRYLLMAGSQFALTLTSTAVLPGVIGVPVEIVYLASTAMLACVSFLVFRNGVFHAGGTETGGHEPPAHVEVLDDVSYGEAQTTARPREIRFPH
jgi:putative flippase GtrA